MDSGTNVVQGRSQTTNAASPPVLTTSALKGLTSPNADGTGQRNKRSKSGFVPRPTQKIKGSAVKKFLGVATTKDKGKGDAARVRKMSIEDGNQSPVSPDTLRAGTEKIQQIESFARRLEGDLSYLQDIYAKFQNYTATTAQGIEDGKQLAKAFLEYSKQNGGDYGECLHAVAIFQVGLEETRLKLSNALIEVFASPVKEFIEVTIPEALRSKERYDEARFSNIEAETKMNKQKPGKATILAQIEYNKAKYTYERTQEEAIKLLKESMKQVNQDILGQLCDYLEAYSQFFTQGHQMLSRLQPSLERYREFTQKQKDEDRRQKEEQERKEAEKREALILEQKKYAEEGHTSLFGAPLAALYEKEGISPPQVPSIYDVLIRYIRDHGLNEVGLFRVAAAQNATTHIMKQIVTASGRPIELEGDLDPHAVAGVLKKLLRQLPEPLLTFELWDKFVLVITGDYNTDAERILALREVVHSLPPYNFATAKRVVELCAQVAGNSAVNRMSPSGLGALLGPNLAYPAVSEDADLLRDMSIANLLVEFLIQHYSKLFENDSVCLLPTEPGTPDSEVCSPELERRQSESRLSADAPESESASDGGEELTDGEEPASATDDDEQAGRPRPSEDFASLYEREVIKGVGWSSGGSCDVVIGSGDSGASSSSGGGSGTIGTISSSGGHTVSRATAKLSKTVSTEDVNLVPIGGSMIAGMPVRHSKSHARTVSGGAKPPEASDDDAAGGASPSVVHKVRHLVFTAGGGESSDDERRDGVKKKKEKKDKKNKKEKKEKKEKDKKDKSGISFSSLKPPKTDKLISPRKQRLNKDSKEGLSVSRTDPSKPDQAALEPSTPSSVAGAGSGAVKLAPMEEEMDIALKAFGGAGQDADEAVKEAEAARESVPFPDLNVPSENRHIRLRRSLSGGVPSAAAASKFPIKRRGSSRGVEVKRRSSCLSTLTLVNEDLLERTIEEIFHTDSYSGWLVVGYKDATTLELQASGAGGVEDLVSHLKDTEVQFALLRLPIVAQEDVDPSKSMISRDIFIGWIGPKVGIVQKGRKKAHVGEVKELLKPFHAELFALRRTSFTESVVRDKSGPLSGSHMID